MSRHILLRHERIGPTRGAWTVFCLRVRSRRMTQPEVWLRGPLPEYLDELQPVAHSLLQVREELEGVLSLTSAQLWARPGGVASIGFHLRHLAGSLDRL